MIALNSTYDPLLVFISIVVAIVSSFVALSTVPRIHCVLNTQWDSMWVIVFGMSMGAGIWSMHFIGMMAFDLPIPVYYDITLTIISLLLAITVCSIAVLPLREGGAITATTTMYMGTIVGCGVAGMHYMGMAAMQVNASMHYSPSIVFLSIVIAVIAASAALFIANYLRDTAIFSQMKLKVCAAIVMGLAVSSMHYTAMTGMQFVGLESSADFSGHIDPYFLASAVVMIALLIQGGTLIAALLGEAYFAANASKELAKQRSEMDHALFSILAIALEQHPLNEILDQILRILLDTDCLSIEKKGAVFIADSSTRTLEIVAHKNLNSSLLQRCGKLDFGTCLCGQAAQSRKVIHKSCIDHEHIIHPEGMTPHGHYCVPVLDKRNVLGVINLYVKHGHETSPLECQFLESVAKVIVGIIKRKRMEEKLERMSFEDGLTGLPNRTLLLDRLAGAINGARRYSYNVSVLFLDIDGFKAVNDTLGHQVGDKLLIEVAARLQSVVREMDTVARIGGDEFVLVLSHIDGNYTDATVVAQKIIAKLTSPFLLDDEACHIGCSIGIASYPMDAEFPDVLIRKADEAMYAVKHSGKNNFIHYSHEWSHVLSMSNPEIDREHALLIEQLNTLHNHIEGEKSNKDEVMLVLDHIFNATVEHFKHEEKLFAEKGFPDARKHARIHRDISNTLTTAIHSMASEPDRQQWIEACLQIKERLIDHVLKEDIKYIKYLHTE